jgi:anaerobic ribonucleoside-triphosphate reductase activating protein
VVSVDALFAEICENPLLKGVTFSGGEPFCQPEPLAELARLAHGSGLDVTTYTGYRYEELLSMQSKGVSDLLAQTDTLIDGPFILAEKDLTLAFRGSRNQRIMDMRRGRS